MKKGGQQNKGRINESSSKGRRGSRKEGTRIKRREDERRKVRELEAHRRKRAAGKRLAETGESSAKRE